MRIRYLWSLLCILTTCFTGANEVYVSPSGNDRNPGTTPEAPKQTLNAALRQAREMRRLGEYDPDQALRIILQEGTYPQYEPLFIRPEDSGTPHAPTLITGVAGKEVVISGGVEIKNWKKGKGNTWVADVPAFNGRPLDFRQVWVNGKKAVRCRDVEDFNQMHRILDSDPVNRILWVPADAVKKVVGAPYAELVIHQMWCIANLRIRSIETEGDRAAVRFHDPESRIQFEHPWPHPVLDEGRESPFYLTGAPGLLDRPGEWYHDIDAQKLWYIPRPGEDMGTARIVVPAIETLVQVEGTPDRPVAHITFENIHFRHATWMRPSLKGHVPLQAGMYLTDGYQISPLMERPDNNHPLDNQDWIGRPGAAVTVSNGAAIHFTGCYFEQLGSTALDYITGCQGGSVTGSTFRDIAGTGIMIGSFSPPAHETHFPYNPADNREVCKDQYLADNLLTDIGNEDWGCCAILAGYVSGVHIEHNEIYDVPYSGISVGWGWTKSRHATGYNRIHANYVHRFARHMYAVGGLYLMGAQPGTIVTENRVEGVGSPPYAFDPDYWFYIYGDEGTSYVTVKDNWTEAIKYGKNSNGPSLWENNGPQVSETIKEKAGRRINQSYKQTKSE